MPDFDRQKAIRDAELRGFLDQLDRMQLQLLDRMEQQWKRLLGQRFDEIMNSREAAERALEDSEARIRRGAFSVIAIHWKPTSAFEHVYKRAVLTDPDFNVRAAAVACLAPLYRGTKNPEMSTMFAHIVSDQNNSIALRRASYAALCEIQGATFPHEQEMALLKCTEDLPKELNWDLVNSFMK